MNVPPLQRPIDPAQLQPDQLLNNPRLSEEQKLGEAARQFEAMLVRQILQNSQKTVIPSSFSTNSTASSIYQDLVALQLADSISKSGTLGLAKMLHHQLSHQPQPASTAGRERRAETQPTASSANAAARPSSCSAPNPDFEPATAPAAGGRHTIP